MDRFDLVMRKNKLKEDININTNKIINEFEAETGLFVSGIKYELIFQPQFGEVVEGCVGKHNLRISFE